MQQTAILIVGLVAATAVADIPNPKYEAALRRVEKQCGHLNEPRARQLRELAKTMHGEGATRNATKKACRAIVTGWPTDFSRCSNAIVAIEYIPTHVPEHVTPPSETDDFSLAVKQALMAGAAELESRIKYAREDAIDTRKRMRTSAYHSKETRKLIIRNSNKRLAELKSLKEKGNYVGTLRLRTGSVGILRSDLTVTQVVDDSNMIVRDHDRGTVWIKDYAVGNTVDGSRYHFPDLFEYVGTKQYTTVLGGSKTLHVIRPVTLTPDERAFLDR